MIPLVRDRSNGVIHENFKGDEKRKLERELLVNQRKIKKGEIDKHPFNSDKWKAAKDQLKKETHDKCAYCEALTSLVAYGDVEHYRPKSKYWWLAYAYENYLVSCQLCNQKFKKAKFPIKNSKIKGPYISKNTTDSYIDGVAGKIAPDSLNNIQVSSFIQLHNQERPYLLNPYVDNPVNYYSWKADEIIKEVELIPSASNPSSKQFTDAAINNYGLNRLQLKQARYFLYSLLKSFKNILKDTSISTSSRNEAQHAISDMEADDAPFAGMIRYLDSVL